MKPSNVMVDRHSSYPEMPLKLIDLDDVRFEQRMTPKRCRINLLHFLEAMPPPVSRFEKYVLLAAYRRERGLSRAKMRRLLPHPAVPG
jgi:hypothetical protein